MKKKFIALLLTFSVFLCGCEIAYVPVEQPTPNAPEFTEGETLTVHYIDVGQADSILLECEDRFMLIDGGNKEDGQLVISYLQQQGVEELEGILREQGSCQLTCQFCDEVYDFTGEELQNLIDGLKK